MYSLVAGSSPLPVRTLADDRDAIQRMAVAEASLTERRPLATSDREPGLADRIRRALGLAPAASECMTGDCVACAA